MSVPIERKPEQDPTLFREKVDHDLPPTTSDVPDPKPLRSRDHYELVVEFRRGKVQVLSVKEFHLPQPESTGRNIGRFALELWTGAELVERVRFDFPLLGASTAREEDPLGAGLSAQTKVRIPASSRALRARILDRKTRDAVEIAWPPERPNDSGQSQPEAAPAPSVDAESVEAESVEAESVRAESAEAPSAEAPSAETSGL